jgi:hypothetical protein
MAGSKTRFGFLGGGEEPPDSGESGAARTVIGHDIHLQKLPSGYARPSAQISSTLLAPTPVPRTPLPRAQVLAPMTEAITESIPVRRPYRPQKSRLARFLGRWTAGGHFHSRSRMGDSTNPDDAGLDDLELPRDTTGRNVLLVLIIAALTFAVTFAIVKVRQRYAAPQPPAGAQVADPGTTQPTAQPTAPPPLPAAATPATAPAQPTKPLLLGTPLPPPAAAPPASPPRPRPAAASPSPAKTAQAPARPSAAPAPKATPQARKATRAEEPATELPEHLKGELLPLTP